jgi:hypothetical protein
MLVFILLFLINVWSLSTLKQPENLKELKSRYDVFLKNTPKEWPELKRRSIITGFYNKNKELGYNINKGEEIGVCMGGTANQMMHVLIHELAHTTVEEYDHSPQFWKNYSKLKQYCVDLGVYQEIPESTKFCGKYIRD